MGDDFNIMLGIVEVCKNKGCLIIHNGGTIAASLLSFCGKKVHQLVFNHVIKEFGGFRRKPVIELLSCFHDFIRVSCRLRISGAELDCRIGIA